MNTKKSIIAPLVGSAAVFYLTNRLLQLLYRARASPGGGIPQYIAYIKQNFVQAILDKPLLLDLSKEAVIVSSFAAFVFMAVCLERTLNKKNYRKGEEHGSASWGEAKDRKPYKDKDYKNNVILSNTEFLTMSSRLPKKLIKFSRNKNVLLVGGSGSGKTRFFAKPNLMQLHSSYVVTDPKGTLLPEVGKLFQENGYKIRFLNLIDLQKSMRYNPFAYVRTEEDILKLVDNLIANTNDPHKQGGDKFWEDAERLLYYACFFYVYFEGTEDEKSIPTVVELLKHADVSEDPEYKSPLDILFEDLEKKKPEHLAVSFYKDFKKASEKTAQGILISESARLAKLKIPKVKDLLSADELELDKIGEEKTILFVIIPDTHQTFNFIAAIMYTQLFDTLCFTADNLYRGRLPIHVRCILDEFANIGLIPSFEKLIATIRSREISATIILQTLSQLKGLYKDHAETIIGNCDSFIYLGGKDNQAHKEVSAMLGKATVDILNVNTSRSKDRSTSWNYSQVGRELMTPTEVAEMDGGKCIVSIRGSKSFFSDKYDIEKHPNYRYLADFNSNNYFDVSTVLHDTDQLTVDGDIFEITI